MEKEESFGSKLGKADRSFINKGMDDAGFTEDEKKKVWEDMNITLVSGGVSKTYKGEYKIRGRDVVNVNTF